MFTDIDTSLVKHARTHARTHAHTHTNIHTHKTAWSRVYVLQFRSRAHLYVKH